MFDWWFSGFFGPSGLNVLALLVKVTLGCCNGGWQVPCHIVCGYARPANEVVLPNGIRPCSLGGTAQDLVHELGEIRQVARLGCRLVRSSIDFLWLLGATGELGEPKAIGVALTFEDQVVVLRDTDSLVSEEGLAAVIAEFGDREERVTCKAW